MSKDKEIIRTMSKKSEKKNLILHHALKLFNENGIEYVGMREIAADLGFRVGNITYYFPTKNDIIEGLTAELVELNSRVIVPVSGLTITGFMDMYSRVFENQYEYRCLFINFIHHLEQNKKFEQEYLSRQEKRYETLRNNMMELSANNYLKSKVDAEKMEHMVSGIGFISRFWLSEARVKFKKAPKKVLFQHYLALLANFIMPYCNDKGKKEIKEFIARL